ncbi:unnamed protein product [Cuscuta campestris]|uniref:Retrovirus-related Pol polyprotein from transposon TNT 1-94-like beta-barrel domain-containing protein n=1 Tax=Cuscuta campestris TaxID=132261 RepID=A0A484L3I2_9ASTE|nr:unnamed protein product [Cuscuta campestris]
MGTVCLKTNTGCGLTLRDVRHVPEFQFNLISAKRLDGDGYVSRLSEGKGDQSTAPPTDLSHKRLGHMIESCQNTLPEGGIPFLSIHSDHGGEDGEQCCGDDVAHDGDVLEPPHSENGVLPPRVPQIAIFERDCYREEVKKVH